MQKIELLKHILPYRENCICYISNKKNTHTHTHNRTCIYIDRFCFFNNQTYYYNMVVCYLQGILKNNIYYLSFLLKNIIYRCSGLVAINRND